ncbi:MAG: AHH domain-containing protein [Lachnospiraceae bacterium]|nr:AHH domain-containing protein [Lachnospiraceae bacterium]
MSKGISGLFSNTIGWLVHHNGRIIPGKDGVVTGGDSQKLKANLLVSMGLPKRTIVKNYQAQHIIPAELRNHPIIRKIGMDFDDATNGIFLPVSGNQVNTISKHRGYHSIYSKFVLGKLNNMDINLSSLELQKQVKSLQRNLRKLQESGLPLYKGFSSKDSKSKLYPHRQGNSVDLWERKYNNISQEEH